MTRRRFAFWLGFGLFSLAQKLRVYGLDELAAATMRVAAPTTTGVRARPIHWRAVDNEAWQWYERETFIDGKWTLSGITTPLSKQTGERHVGDGGYLDDTLVPENMRRGYAPHEHSSDEHADRQPSPKRRARRRGAAAPISGSDVPRGGTCRSPHWPPPK